MNWEKRGGSDSDFGGAGQEGGEQRPDAVGEVLGAARDAARTHERKEGRGEGGEGRQAGRRARRSAGDAMDARRGGKERKGNAGFPHIYPSLTICLTYPSLTCYVQRVPPTDPPRAAATT